MELMEKEKTGFKKTEVGLIPKDWELIELLKLIDEHRHIRYGVVQPGKYTPSGCLMLRSQDYSKGWNEIETMHRVSPNIELQYKGTKLKKNDLVITIVGAGIGQVVKIPNRLEGTVLSRSTARIAINPEKSNYNFVYHFLGSSTGKKQILFGIKEGAQPVVSASDVGSCLIPIPPTLEEQKAIATALGDTDALITGLENLIAKKKAIKQGAMQQLLTPPSKEGNRLPGFKEEWEEKRLGEIADIKTGSKNNQDKIEGGLYPFFVRSQTVERINSFSYNCEAILIPGEGGIGTIFHYINGKFDVHQRVYKISGFSQNVIGKFIYYQIVQNFYDHAMKNSVKATVDSLRLPSFQKFEISLPPDPYEQSAIVGILDDMEKEIEALESKKAKYNLVKQGMMQELLTGKTRLV